MDPGSFVSDVDPVGLGGLGLGLLLYQGGWPPPFGVSHLRSGTGGTWKSGEKRCVFAVIWLSGDFR